MTLLTAWLIASYIAGTAMGRAITKQAVTNRKPS